MTTRNRRGGNRPAASNTRAFAAGSGSIGLLLALTACTGASGTPSTNAAGGQTSTPSASSTAGASSTASATGIPSMKIAGTTCVPIAITTSQGSGGEGGQSGTPPTGAADNQAASPPSGTSAQGGTPPAGAPATTQEGSGGSGQVPPAPPDGSGTADGPGGTPPTGAPGGQAGTPPSGAAGEVAPLTDAASGTQGNAQGGTQGGAPGGSNASDYQITGATTVKGEAKNADSQTFTSSTTDQSALLAQAGGVVTLASPTVTKSGDTSSNDASSFYGLNAAVLASDGGAIGITGGELSSTSTGSNVLFSYGSGSIVCQSGGTLAASAQGGHAAMASGGGTILLENVDMSSKGANGATVATDRGSGTVIVQGGTATTSGADSPVLYSTGDLRVSDLTGTAKISEGAVIEGDNSITLTNSTISAASEGVMLYQSMSGDANVGTATLTMSGGSITTDGSATGHYSGRKGDGIYVGNTNATITLKNGAQVGNANGTFLFVTKDSTAALTADGVTISGDVTVESGSSATLTYRNGTKASGAIAGASLTLDASSTWSVTGDSRLTSLAGAQISGSQITNIEGGGHTVTYDASAPANTSLGGKTFELSGGGQLRPA